MVGGDSYYGKTDYVPGLFYVRTRFLHVCFVPLVPRESYLFIDRQPWGSNWGVRIGLCWKSVFLGWLRGLFLVFIIWFLIASVVIILEPNNLKAKDVFTLQMVFRVISVPFALAYWATLLWTRASEERAFELAQFLGLPERILPEYLRGCDTSLWRLLTQNEGEDTGDTLSLQPHEKAIILQALGMNGAARID